MPSIEARSTSGRIELILPDKAAFHLEATAEHGDATNDYGPAIQKEVDGRTAVLKGSVGAGPTVHLTVSRGSVEVRKEGTEPSDTMAPPPPPNAPPPPKVPKNPKDTEVKM